MWKSTSPNSRKSDELNSAVDRNFSIDPIALPVSTQAFCDKISDNSSRDIYKRCRFNLASESVNTVAPQFVNNGISAIAAPNKSAGIWIPSTIIRSLPYVTHWSAADHGVGKGAAVGDAVEKKSDYRKENYKTDFEIWIENSKLQFRRKNIERS